MNTENATHEISEENVGSGYFQLQHIFSKLTGKRIKFCLKNNNYDPIVLFETMLTGFRPCKQLGKIGNREFIAWTFRIENDKGIEIYFPLCKLIRIDKPDNINANSYFFIYEKHFWSLEVLTV